MRQQCVVILGCETWNLTAQNKAHSLECMAQSCPHSVLNEAGKIEEVSDLHTSQI